MTMNMLHGDCLDVLPTLAAESADAIVCDPPYGLAFMGNAWDHGVPGAPFWEAALRVVKPGAYLLAFGGTRTYHRLTCAIEDAGWEIHDCLSWLYGSGFPKHASKLKPGWEPIVLARRPAPRATPLNIDACRVVGAKGAGVWGSSNATCAPAFNSSSGRHEYRSAAANVDGGNVGRWPANVVLDEDAAAALDAQSGELTSGANPTRRGTNKFASTYGEFVGQADCVAHRGVDTGGASRFYYVAKASRAEREAGLGDCAAQPTRRYGEQGQGPLAKQTPRVERGARNHHPTVKPVALMRWLVRLVTPPGGLVLDPFTGSGSTGCAAVLGLYSIVFASDESDLTWLDPERLVAELLNHIDDPRDAWPPEGP